MIYKQGHVKKFLICEIAAILVANLGAEKQKV